MTYEPSNAAIETAISEYTKEKDGVYIHDFENALKAAIAIDEETIAKAWIASQWIPFEEKEHLIDTGYYLVVENEGEEACAATYGAKCVVCGYEAFMRFDCDGYPSIEKWFSAFQLKALGV